MMQSPEETTFVSTADVESGPSVFELDFYRNKVREFQQVMDSLDWVGGELRNSGAIAYLLGDPDYIAEYEQLIAEFDSKRSLFVNAAQAIQLASQGINAVGVNFPTVQVPFGLQAVPLIPLGAMAAAVAGAVALITWAREFFKRVSRYAERAQTIEAIMQLPEEQRGAALATMQKLEHDAEVAEAAAGQSPLSALATIVKWGAVAGIGYLIWRQLSKD